eukprot:GHVL01010372.1.p1 GENE.GHVL01010372.1~~GHVL01010372.1.p1  ORF type:complete len:279 (+),score=37.16 GHVL01010372.1:72-908(+)
MVHYPCERRFPRFCRYGIVPRMRAFVKNGLYERPRWLEWTERAPPLEIFNLKIKDIMIRNPFPRLIRDCLRKYPDLRFQDCFVDGNDWSKGNDRYRQDHPVTQFVTYQKMLMNTGIKKNEAFKMAEQKFYARRVEHEKEQKLNMAMSLKHDVDPMFTTGAAYYLNQIANLQKTHLNTIRKRLIHERNKAEGTSPEKDFDRPVELKTARVASAKYLLHEEEVQSNLKQEKEQDLLLKELFEEEPSRRRFDGLTLGEDEQKDLFDDDESAFFDGPKKRVF